MVRVLRFLVVAVVVVGASVAPAMAGPANPRPHTLTQPDGAQFVVRSVGDEWSNAEQTLDGFAVLRNEATGFFVYANKAAGGNLVPTDLIVGRDAPTGLTRGVRPEPTAARGPLVVQSPPGIAAVTGARKLLVILVQFTNKSATTSAASWQSRMFGATNSVKNHYAVSSHGNLTVTAATESEGTPNDGIVGWLSLPRTHPNTAGNTGEANMQLTKDAILAADPFVNFASYDTDNNGNISTSELDIIVIAAGNETSYAGASGACAPSVWGHQWSIFGSNVTAPRVDGKLVAAFSGGGGYAQFGEMHCAVSSPGASHLATVGIMVHELGHLYGLPDLYDTDFSSLGIGEWAVMSYGSWNSFAGDAGNSPALMDAWCKSVLGWTTRTLVSGTLPNQGIVESSLSGVVYQFRAGTPGSGTGEYFLVENREKTGYDRGLPAAGLLVWHIDETRSANTAECVPGSTPTCTSTVHYKVALIQADNAFNLERNANAGDGGDPFPGSTAKQTFNGSTTPNSKLWSGAASGMSITGIPSAAASTMTVTLSDGTTVPFTDDPLTVQLSSIKVVHITELRSRINSLRTARGLDAFSWTDATLTATSTTIKVVHLTELRTALTEAYNRAGKQPPTFPDSNLSGMNVKANHISELRTAVQTLENSF